MGFEDALAAAWEDELVARANSATGPRDYVYATGRRACRRHMAYDLTHPEHGTTTDPDALERMRRGQEREEDVVARLRSVGKRCTPPFQVIEGQRRFELRDRDGRVIVVGKIDGRLKIEGTRDRPIFEIKSGRSFERIETLDDLDRSHWTRHTADQMLAYLLAESEPWGVLILETASLPRFLRIELEPNLERAEAFLADARTAIDAAKHGATMPDYHPDRSVCRRCPHHGRVCDAPLDYGQGAQFITDPDVLIDLETVDATRSAASAHATAWERLKKRLRGVENGVAGDFLIRGKWSAKTTIKVPKEIQDQYRKVDEHGRFLIDVSRIQDASRPRPGEGC